MHSNDTIRGYATSGYKAFGLSVPEEIRSGSCKLLVRTTGAAAGVSEPSNPNSAKTEPHFPKPYD